MPGPGGREVGRLSVRVLPDTSGFARSLQRYLDRIERRARVRVRVDVEEPRTAVAVPVRLELRSGEIARLRAELAHITPPITIPARLDVDRGILRRLGSGLSSAQDAATGLIGSLGRITGALASLGAATPAVAGLSASLAQMAPAAAVAAPALGAVALAGGALFAGFRGLGDAIRGDAEALAELAPPARKFALTLRSLGSEWGALQDAVQARLFQGWAEALDRAATSVLPVLGRGLEGAANAMNGMGLAAASAADTMARDGRLGQALDGMNRGLRNLASVPGDLLDAFVSLSAGAAPAFDRVTRAISRGVESIAERLRDGLSSGGLEAAISGALNVAREFWGVLTNVGRIIGNIFGPAADVGGGTLSALREATGLLAEITSAADVQETFRSLFQTLQSVGQVAAGAFGALVSALLPVGQIIIDTLAGPLQDLAASILPVLQNLAQAVGSALAPVAESLSRVHATLLPVVGEIVSAFSNSVLVPLLQTLTPLLADLASTLQDALTPVLEVLPGVLAPIFEAAGQLLPIFGELAAMIISELAPSIMELSEMLVVLLEAAGPLLVAEIQALSAVMQALMPVLETVIEIVGGVVRILTRLARGVIEGIVVPVVEGLTALLRGDFSGAWEAARNLVGNVAGFIGDMALGIGLAIGGMVSSALGSLGSLVASGWRHISNFAERMWQGAQRAASRLLQAIGRGVSNAASEVGRLPRRAVEALGNVGRVLFQSGRALIQGFIDGIRSKLGALGDAVGGVLGFVGGFFPNSPAKRGPFSGRGWTLYSGRAVVEDFAAGMRDYRRLSAAAAEDVALAASVPLSQTITQAPEYVGLRPGDRIALTVDGQHTLDAVIQRSAENTIDRTLIDPARLGRL